MTINYLRQYVKADVARPEIPERTTAGGLLVEELLHGQLIEGPGGACFVAESAFGGEHRHGLHEFAGLAEVTPGGLSTITGDGQLAFADLAGAVFLDTETTGLNMGTGTYVFLVGAGYFEDGEFKVKQFFLRDPGEELPYLAALDVFLRRFSLLVTFNGKAFDWPLLESRFVRQRDFRRAPLDDPPHVDLLHPARRLWKRRLESCRLSSLERSILGVARTEEDVPGYLIPAMYFAYLRSRDGRPLRGVFYHNLHDILSLATLTIHLHRIMTDPLGGLLEHGLDYLSLGKTLERAGDGELALTCYEEALARSLSSIERSECLLRLAGLHKRERKWESALAVWDRLIDDGGEGALIALVERAKFYEHVERSYLEALEDTQQALNLLELRGEDVYGVDRRDLEHRRGRLINRSYRHRSWTAGR
jgi:uncharacterized protein YprB with RNaseH-like and TPR domain